MKIHKTYIVVGLIIAFTAFFELTAHASESDQATTLTFNQPIQIPGQILPAGTYYFQLLDTISDRNVVQIFNSERTQIYATLLTVSAERSKPAEDTTITLAEQGAGKPDAILQWFYPGREIGHQFLYPEQQEKQLAQDRQQTVVGNQTTNANSWNAEAGN